MSLGGFCGLQVRSDGILFMALLQKRVAVKC